MSDIQFPIEILKERIAQLEAENAALTKWKHEAVEVICRWDAVFTDAQIPNPKLGASKAELVSEYIAALREQSVYLFNLGYHSGHHDTVEARYVHILDCDMKTYHADIVDGYLKEQEK